ncbi:MAG: flippase-like domain-containing protein [Phycisphaerae bacterium]|nr:flippase-like domain-containing protein [Phycisphaerae bacterium]
MTTGAKQVIKLLLRLAVTAGLLVWVFSQQNVRGQFWQAARTVRWECLILVWLLTLLYFWVSSIKLRIILRQQGIHAGVGIIFGASAIAALYSMIVPGILSTAAKWYVLEKDTGKGSAVFSSMLYNQLSITVIVLAFGLTGIIVTNPISVVLSDTTRPWVLPVTAGLLLAGIVVTTLLLLNPRTGGPMVRASLFWLRPLPAAVRQRVQKVSEQIAVFQSAPVRFHAKIAMITFLASCVIGVLVYVGSARAANIHVPLGVLVWVSSIIYVLGRLPISLANLGVREVTLVGFLASYGVEKPGALLMSMILFSTSVLMAIIGAGYQLAWFSGSRRTRDREPAKGISEVER